MLLKQSYTLTALIHFNKMTLIRNFGDGGFIHHHRTQRQSASSASSSPQPLMIYIDIKYDFGSILMVICVLYYVLQVYYEI